MTLAPERIELRDAEARLPITRYFTRPEVDPYDELEWELRTASIEGVHGTPVFEQRDVEFPVGWPQNRRSSGSSSVPGVAAHR